MWTERMLAALDKGVRGGKWYSLIDKVYALDTLRDAFAKVKANRGAAGVDHRTIGDFEHRLEDNLASLAQQLRKGSYRPQALRRVWIPKPGSKEKRPLGIPTVRDRVVQAALRNVVEPIFEQGFAQHSYGFRPGRGCKDALRRVNGLLKAGYTWVVDADLKRCFDTIPHRPLLERIGAKISDGRVMALIDSFLGQGVMEAMALWTPEAGTPQGAVISPLLSNIYLDPFDHTMAGAGLEMVRYADDFVILCRTRQEAERALALVERWLAQAGLTLHPDKTGIVEANQPGGFDFLGYHFQRGRRWPRKKSLDKLKATLRGKLPRTSGKSLDEIVSEVNLTLRGWFEYFKHSQRYTFLSLDSWIRMRLRSILRHRRGWKGRGRGQDHHRWPNAYFADHGLFSLSAAHAEACQSSRR
ncbi:MAG TPA: group II intron reverse transcriptase/maturase [Dehalococcoidia bacterium]|nr:group II intron reverse transcriptase/maturase [Dehalococcoidia bacterium]